MRKHFFFAYLFFLGIALLTSCRPEADYFPSVTGKTDPSSFEKANLLGYFPFESTTYSTIKSIGIDSSKVIFGDSVKFILGERGYCFQGNAVKSYIQYNLIAGSIFQKMKEFTVAAWVKVPQVKDNRITPLFMINGGDTINSVGSLSLTLDSLYLKGYVYSDSAKINTHEIKIDRNLLKSGEWTYVALVYTGATSTLALYINGAKQKEDTCFAAPAIKFVNSTADSIVALKTGALKLNMVKTKMQMTKLIVGAWPQQIAGTATSSMAFFNGNIDEMRIWYKGLPKEAISALYQAELALTKK